MRPADDMDALLAWVKEQALEAHNFCYNNKTPFCQRECQKEERIYNRVIAKIENSRVNQRPHVPNGWDEV